SDVLTPIDFKAAFLRATGVLMRNCGSNTNLEAFLKDFSEFLPTISRDEILSRFMSFYSNEYAQIGKICIENPLARNLIEKMSEFNSLKVVLATNPVFPRLAVLERLSWARIDAGIFDLITDCENMHSCKPRQEYFLEISEKIDVNPISCLMVGDDKINDMAAGTLGMTTFLVLEKQTPRLDAFRSIQKELALVQNIKIPLPDFCGSLKDFLSLLDLVSHCSDHSKDLSHK
ncbi:MAG: HAD family hydrolase, partial [Candidatus Hodarchaeota archaeon]